MKQYIAQLVAQNPLDGTFKGPGAFQPGTGTGAAAGGAPLQTFFTVLLGFFTIIGGLMFLMYFILGGLTWITAGGDKGKVDSAKTQLTNAAIGLVVVVVAHAVVGIVSGVLGLQILSPIDALSGIWGGQ